MTANFVSKLALVPFALLFVATCCPAQTLKTTKPGPLAQCREDLKDNKASMDAAMQSAETSQAKLVAENKELQERIAEQTKKYEELQTAAREYMQSEEEIRATYKQVIDKLSAQLSGALAALNVRRSDTQLAAATEALARQQRINNALAIYGMMPKSVPPQTLNLNVTDCTKFPSLCVH